MDVIISLIVPSLDGNWENFKELGSSIGVEVIIVSAKKVSCPYDNFRCVTETEKGIYNAMNQGASLALGRFLLFCGDDDTPLINQDVVRYLAHLDKSIDYCIAIPQKEGVQCGYELPSLSRFCRRSINHQAVIYSRKNFIVYNINVGLAADYGQLVSYYLQNRRWTVLPFPMVDYNLTGITGSNSIKPAIAKSRLKANWSIRHGNRFARGVLLLWSVLQLIYWKVKA